MVPSCTVYHDAQSVATYCFTGNGGQWWTFDDTWSIGAEDRLAQAARACSARMIWEMSGDTPGGALLGALHSGLQ